MAGTWNGAHAGPWPPTPAGAYTGDGPTGCSSGCGATVRVRSIPRRSASRTMTAAVAPMVSADTTSPPTEPSEEFTSTSPRAPSPKTVMLLIAWAAIAASNPPVRQLSHPKTTAKSATVIWPNGS